MTESGFLDSLFGLFRKAAAQEDWKTALETLATELRAFVVFDNIAVYVLDSRTGALEVAYARALGRGKYAEADAAWGDRVASEVMKERRVVIQTPAHPPRPHTDRLELTYLLGLPLWCGTRLEGAVVLIRFGGPEFSEAHLQAATLIAMWMASMLERRTWQETYHQLDEVQRRIRLQDDFLATISHELRTPLGFIKGYSTTLLRRDANWDETTQREFLAIIEDEADHLTQLIEDLLESARLQSNTLQFKFQPMRLDALIRDVVLRSKQRHPNLPVRLDFGPVAPIHGDSAHLTRVFENLFSNADKYAPNSPLDVTLRQQDETVHIRFTDHGPGIPPEHQAMVFERFYRVPGPDSLSAGTGLGLYICRQIILAHRGKIWLESSPGHGATFHIELPLHAARLPENIQKEISHGHTSFDRG